MGKDRNRSRQKLELTISDPEFLLEFFGPDRSHIDALEENLDVAIGLRGNRVLLMGREEDVERARRIITQFETSARAGAPVRADDLERLVRTAVAHPDTDMGDVTGDVVFSAPGRRLIAPRSPAQKTYVDAIRANDIVFSIGPAGTGKTYLAMAMAVAALKRKQVRRIILTRPAVEAGEKLGFLPGDIAEKVNPYLRPLYDALDDMMDPDKSRSLISRDVIEVAPLAFMRGRTLNGSFVILDEAQNTTVAQMKMFLTRLGFDSKAVITGDITQIDLERGRTSGLVDAMKLLGSIPGIAQCTFSSADVVRHPLVQKIVDAYEERQEGEDGHD
jgi:phosphate starvation-inducible PhoH-like protein